MTANESGELKRIYAGNSLRGRKAWKSGEVKTAPKDDERAERNFFLSVAFTPESEAKIKEICDRIGKIAEKHDVPLVLAGRDFRAHATLQGGVLESSDIEARKKAYGEIYFDPAVLREEEKLAGVPIDFKFVVTNDNSITLTAVEIPDQITKFRAHAKEAAKSQGVAIPPFRDIMHITLARPTALPEEGREEKLRGFLQDMLTLRRELARDDISAKEGRPGEPITLVVDHVFTAPVKRHTHAFTTSRELETRPEILSVEKLKMLGDRMLEIGESMVKMQASVGSRLKEDGSPVTAADLKSETEIIEMAERLFPGWPTVSEETNNESVPMPSYKSIDGLDGTRWFVAGLEGWCLSIGFVRDGEPVAGVIVQPSRNQCFFALKGAGVYSQEGSSRRWNRFVRRRTDRPMFGTDLDRTSAGDPNDPYWANVRNLSAKLGEYPFNSPSIPAALFVARGNFWGWITRNAKNWDVAASYPLITELGGVVEQLNGDSLAWDSIKMPPFLIAESREQADRILEALKSA